ncbi:hypothetical protein CYMTET_20543 [Cymbomonas tetramitiformis]|uniref:Uncharacterized protein n=1 Tax=Cymbomonas tetramitiformis TaxID=36881 RepID=A0AAE0G3Y2_9CHLO|nr:hypothetical protein CYMTET_20543 [Cymbomonas tetramitiformis]
MSNNDANSFFPWDYATRAGGARAVDPSLLQVKQATSLPTRYNFVVVGGKTYTVESRMRGPNEYNGMDAKLRIFQVDPDTYEVLNSKDLSCDLGKASGCSVDGTTYTSHPGYLQLNVLGVVAPESDTTACNGKGGMIVGTSGYPYYEILGRSENIAAMGIVKYDYHPTVGTRYAVLKGSNIVDIQKNGTHVTVRAPDDRVGHGHATIQIDHTSPYTRFTEYVTISVVEKTAFVVTSHAYPSQFDDDPLEKTVVRKVHCTNAYQRLRLRSRVYVSDETAYEVTDASVFSTSANIRVKRGPNEVILVAERRGHYSVSATWKRLVSKEKKIVVNDELARVKTIQHTTNWITSRSGQTFHGVAKSRQTLSLKVHFDDGTTFVDAVNGVQSKWLGHEQYVTFSSDRIESVEVNADGVAILLENHHSEVAIEARTVCDTPDVEIVKNITLVFANLKAGTNDVDLGKNDGAQFAPVVLGETFSVPVLVQAGDARLKLYDVRLSITNDHTLRVADCKIGDDWTNMTFSCTINDPVVEVMIVGSEPNSTATGLVHVATVTFEAWNTSVNSARISGNVYAIGTTNIDTDINADESTAPAIVAGNGEVLFRQVDSRWCGRDEDF